MRKGKGDTCSQSHYSSNVSTVSATTNSGGNVSDLVLTRNCCMVRMLPGEAELVLK